MLLQGSDYVTFLFWSTLHHCLFMSHTEWCSPLLSSTGSRLASPQLFLSSCRPWLWPDSTTYSPWPQRPSFTWPLLRSANTEKQTSLKHYWSLYLQTDVNAKQKQDRRAHMVYLLSLLSLLSAADAGSSWAGSECPAWSHWTCSGPRSSHRQRPSPAVDSPLSDGSGWFQSKRTRASR